MPHPMMTTKNKLIDGILLLDKPLHLTSNGALQRVKRLFGAKKAGHTGSLDPLATGMLPLCFGEATKLSQYLLESDKYYYVVAKFGEKTTTGDAEGEIIETRPISHITLEHLQQAITKFVGVIEQVPPMFSALKHKGKPLYELARQGIEVERKPRPVTIHELRLIPTSVDKTLTVDDIPEDNDNWHDGASCSFFVHCSKGTYIRTLVEDIGEFLGCGGHVIGLRRTAVSPYQESAMVTLQELEDVCKEQGSDALLKYLLPLESSIQHFPVVKLSASTVFYIRTGNPVMVPHLQLSGLVRLFSEQNEFIGIGEIQEDGRVAPRRLLKIPQKDSSLPVISDVANS
jgi:tRNA pseudouridine55 synthase